MTALSDDRDPLALDPARTAELVDDVRTGLGASQKSLPSRWFGDRRGQDLYRRLLALPEYYLTPAEAEIVSRHATELAAAHPVTHVVELGALAADRSSLLLDAWQALAPLRRVVMADVSPTRLAEVAVERQERYPTLEFQPVELDAIRHLGHLRPEHRPSPTSASAVVCLGSLAGNLTDEERFQFFTEVRELLRGPDDVFVLGLDLVKSLEVLLPAYDDPEGVAAAYNLNVLRVLNRELDGDLPEDDFSHEAVWDEHHERVEMRLRANRPVDARLAGAALDVHFDEDECLRTLTAAKFRPDGIRRELAAAGFTEAGWWTDTPGRFAVSAWV